MFFSEEKHPDGEIILRGRYQFTSAEATANKPAQKAEVLFRCKGKPAEEIKQSGIHSTGVAEGYIDHKIVHKEVRNLTFTEKQACFVIRNWEPGSDIFTTPTVFNEVIELVDDDEEVSNQNSNHSNTSDNIDEDEEFNDAYNPEMAPRPAVTFSF